MNAFKSRRRIFLKRSFLATVAALVARSGVAADNPGPSKIIDAHCHAGKGSNFGKPGDTHAPWTTYNSPEETLRKMEQAGIDQTIIFPISNETYKEANEEIAGFICKWPDKLIGFAKHDAKKEKGQIAKLLKHEVEELGLRGLKLHGVPSDEMMDSAEALNIPILFHPPEVDVCHEALESHPNVNFIMAHLGSFSSRRWEEHVRAIEATKRHPNLYLETSSVVFFLYLQQAARELPPEKLIFGTDGPLVDSRIELQKIRMLKLEPDHERKVLSENIQRLLGDRG
jgi:hypothetical protein